MAKTFLCKFSMNNTKENILITRIQGAKFDKKSFQHTNPPPALQAGSNLSQINTVQSIDSQLLKNYYINFTAKKEIPFPQQYDNIAADLEKRAINLAKKYKHKEANHYHFIDIAYKDTLEYIDKLNKGEADLYDLKEGDAPSFFANIFSDELYKNETYRKEFQNILIEEKKHVDDILEKMPKKPEKSRAKTKISASYYNDFDTKREEFNRMESVAIGYDIFNAVFCSSLDDVSKYSDNFSLKVNDLIMLENKDINKRLHFSNYDKRAENVIKNLSLGTNMMITYDHTKVNPNYFVPSIIKAFEKSNGKLNPQNTKIIEFNSKVKMLPLLDKLIDLTKNKDENYIVMFSQRSLAHNAQTVDDGTPVKFGMPFLYLQYLGKTPKNIHLVLFDAKDNYLGYFQNNTIAKAFKDFGEISIPVLNSKDVAATLKQNDKFLESNKFSKAAIDKITNISSQMDGNFPDKTLNLIQKISSFYVDKAEITSKDIDLYVKEAEHLFKQSNNDSSVEIVFDTGKRLKDIIGKTNTKKEAEYIIRQIKSNKIGTKGFIIYSQDGTIGGGRRHTAEVIAGESNVPFVSINTMDFGTKEVDLFGSSAMTPEASIKKLFSLVTTQAEANPHKGAVLFIENFEYFSVGELISEYHQKAMAQLIREMENAEKKGLNIIVMGSVSNPSLIGESAMKSFKFNDTIEVSSPAINEQERYDILKYSFKNNKSKLAGNPEEQDKLIKDMAKTLRGFAFIELKSFAKKAESIAQERGHKEITKTDMIESYLRITTGRPSMNHIEQHEKELTTKHECGHAITLQVMNDLMKNSGKSWHIPDTVNFITLDPRGYYGGAMYSKKDANSECSFEKNFTDIVCSYGGHSAEKYFYDMDGSWGITCDLDLVTSAAENMVTAMGQGYYTGKISLANMYGEKNFSRNITPNLRNKIEQDVNVITRNALTVSDAIVEAYSGFINEFSNRYSHLVGTGECLVDGDVFRKELAEWKERQSEDKKAELDTLDTIILDAIKASKNGKIY